MPALRVVNECDEPHSCVYGSRLTRTPLVVHLVVCCDVGSRPWPARRPDLRTCSHRTITWWSRTGLLSSRKSRRRSAGGQLEHPSEVKSSSNTGTRVALSSAAVQISAEADKVSM